MNNKNQTQLPFVGRKFFISEFLKCYHSINENESRVMSIYGMGGIGKTRLSHQLQSLIQKKEGVDAYINFQLQEYRNPQIALFKLRTVLYNKHKLQFPTFDIAFAIYWKLSNPHLSLKNSDIWFLSEGEITGEIISVIEDAPVLGLVAKIPRFLFKAGKATKTWWNKRGKNELKNIASIDDPVEIQKWLKVFWVNDIMEWTSKKKTKKLVIFLDTYEALEGPDTRFESKLSGFWLKEIASNLKGAMIVITGQRKLQDIDERFVDSKNFLENELKGLSDEDQQVLLRKCGIEQEDIRNHIIENSFGSPIYLEQAVRLYQEINENAKRIPSKSDFDIGLGRMIDTFLNFKSESLCNLLFVLSVPRRFDFSLFKKLAKEFNIAYPTTKVGFQNLQRATTVVELEKGVYHLHDLIKRALRENDNEDGRKEVHLFLFEEMNLRLKGINSIISTLHRIALNEAVYHGMRCLEKEKFYSWYEEMYDIFRRKDEWELLLETTENLLIYVIKQFGKSHKNTYQIHYYLGQQYLSSGNYDQSEEHFRFSLKGFKKELGRNDKVFLFNMVSLADLLRLRGKHSEAIKLSNDVIEIVEGIGESNSIDPKIGSEILNHSKNNLGLIYLLRQDSFMSIRLFEEVIKLSKHNEELLAVYTGNLAMANLDADNLEEARKLCDECLERRKKFYGEMHQMTFLAERYLAQLNIKEKEFEKAQMIAEGLLAKQKEILGPFHRDVFQTHRTLAKIMELEGNFTNCKSYLTDIVEMQREYLGEFDIDTLQTTNELANHYLNNEMFKEAKHLFDETIGYVDEKLDKSHFLYLKTRKDYALLLRKMGDYEESKRIYFQVLELQKDVLGEFHRETIRTYLYLGQLFNSIDEKSKAGLYFKKCANLREKHLGHTDVETAIAYKNLADFHRDTGNETESLENLWKAYEVFENLNEEYADFRLDTLTLISFSLSSTGNFKEAEKHLFDVFNSRVKRNGKFNVKVFFDFQNLTNLYIQYNLYNEAEIFFSRIHKEIRKKELINNPIKYYYQYVLASIYYSKEDFENAEIIFDEVVLKLRNPTSQDYSIIKNVYSKLIFIKIRKQDLESACEIADKWDTVIISHFGEENNLRVQPLIERIIALFLWNKFDLAELESRRCMEFCRSIFHKNEDDVFKLNYYLIFSLIKQAKLKEAQEHLNQNMNMIDGGILENKHRKSFLLELNREIFERINNEGYINALKDKADSLISLKNNRAENVKKAIGVFKTLSYIYQTKNMIINQKHYLNKAMKLEEDEDVET